MRTAFLVGLAAAVIGAGGGLLSRSGAPPDAAAALVPGDALIYAHLATDRDDELLDTLGRLPSVRALWTQLQSTISSTASGFDYQRDIEPWLGDEVAIALLDTGQAVADTLILLAVADEPRAQGLLTRAAGAQSGVAYKGIAVRRFGSVAAAFVGGFLAIGQERRVKAAIDLHEGGSGALADRAAYRAATRGRPDAGVLEVFAAAGGVRRVLRVQPGLVGALGALLDDPALEGVAVSAWADDGLRMNARRARRTGESEEFEPRLLRTVPDDAVAYLGLPSLRPLAGLLGRLQAALGEVELGPELLRSLRGEVAFSVTPGLPVPIVTLTATTRDERRTSEALGRLQSAIVDAVSPAAGDEPDAGAVPTFEERRIAGVNAYALRLGPDAEIIYAVFDGRLVISTGAAGIERVRRSGDSLADDERFERALSHTPAEAEALLFLDLAQLLTLGEQAGLTASSAIQGARDDLRRMRLLGAAVKREGDDTTAELFLEIP